MTDRLSAYSNTVVGRGALAASLLLAVAVAVPIGVIGHWWAAVPALLVTAGAGVSLSTVRVTAGPERLVVGAGPWSRRIAVDDIAEAESTTRSVAGVLGIAEVPRWRTTKLTVRPGPTLALRLRDGEVVRLSTDDPAAAIRVMGLTPGDVDEGNRS